MVSRPLSNVILVLLTLAIAALSIGSVRLDSATADEPAHIAAGYLKLVYGKLDFFREQPPLMNSITAVPLVIAGYRFPPEVQPGEDHWTVGRRFLYRSGYDAHRILFLARLPTIALLLALCWLVYLVVARESGSPAWGIAAFALTGFCPNVMAHGRLAAVDLAVTFFCFLAAMLFLRLIEAPRIGVAVAFGVASACAVLSKTSGAILAPWCAVVLVLALLGRKVTDRRRLFVCIGISLLSAVIVLESMTLMEASAGYVRQRVPSGSLAGKLALPLRDWKENIDIIRMWNADTTKLQYFMGHFSSRGWKAYYPVAFLLKTTLPALLLCCAAIALSIRWRPPPFAALALAIFVALFFAAAVVSHLALGLRYILPVYPFLYAAAAIALSTVELRRASLAIVVVLLSWHIAENLIAYPSYISYFNELIGSHRNADRYLIDSNLDWGQDLRRLDAWCRRNGVRSIAIDYFGGGDPAVELSHGVIPVRGAGTPPLPRGYFAVSRHSYRTSDSTLVSNASYGTYLASIGAKYVTTIGGSIDVYRIE